MIQYLPTYLHVLYNYSLHDRELQPRPAGRVESPIHPVEPAIPAFKDMEVNNIMLEPNIAYDTIPSERNVMMEPNIAYGNVKMKRNIAYVTTA